MNRIQLPAAIRTTAAAMAVFMTVATLNAMIQVAGPEQSALIAQTSARQAARAAAASHTVQTVAQAATLDLDH
jgi:hypothetical protein